LTKGERVKKEDVPPKHSQDMPADESQDIVITTDRELNIISWSKAAQGLFGWKAEEVMGAGAASQVRHRILHVLTRDSTLQHLMQNGCWSGEENSFQKNGNCIRTRVIVNVLWDREGRFNGVAAVFRQPPDEAKLRSEVNQDQLEKAVKERTQEITKANRLLQQELSIHKRAALSAKESEGKNRDLVDNIKLGIFRCTPGTRGKFLEVNQAMQEITGYSRDELLQMDICDL
jgi:PAS domain S-box-containing protein